MTAVDPNEMVTVPLYQHQIEAFELACRLFGLDEGGDDDEHFQK